MSDPINLNPIIAVVTAAAPTVSQALTDGNITVNEAIDIAAAAAKEVARQKGIADSVIATTNSEATA